MEDPLPPSVLRHDNEWSWAAGGVATVRRNPSEILREYLYCIGLVRL